MATYLLIWNPERWPWRDLQTCIETVDRNGYYEDSWSCGVTKKIRPDDRVFLIKLGAEPRGIVASGWATSEVYAGKHWDREARALGKTALYIDVHFDTILDPRKGLLPRTWLDNPIYAKMQWEARASGTTIHDEVAEHLERDWARFLNRPVPFREFAFAEEAEVSRTYNEGTQKQITVNAYERSAEARALCIKYHGLNCSVCGFSFEEIWGEIGSGFIHVHHLKPLSEIRKNYKVDPRNELCPVCPNCHAMLHQRTPAYRIDELKAILRRT